MHRAKVSFIVLACFRFNALWLAAIYDDNPLFMMKLSFLFTPFWFAPTSAMQLGRKTRIGTKFHN